MFEGRSRGPKTSTWTRRSQDGFESFFARRSELLKVAAEDQPHDEPLMTAAAFKWMFSSFGDEPKQVCAAQGAPIRGIVLGVTGTLVALGTGEAPGHGTCERFWMVDEQEVPEGTAGAIACVRGGTGDLQLQIADDTLAWFSGVHCRPWIADDGALPASLKDTLLLPRPPSPPPAHRSASPLPDAVRPAATFDQTPTTVATAATAATTTTALRDQPAADVEQARLCRQLKHQEMRDHLRWVVASSPRFKSQTQLADAFGCARQWLSQYMTGKDQRGRQLGPLELNKRHSDLLHYLRLCCLPTETPTADAVAAAAATAATEEAPPKPSRAAPVFVAAPKASVLSINLKDVEGWQEGGECHLLALGVPVLGDSRWLLACPGSDGERELRLRIGLRGRRTLSARSHASLAGRTFEWWLETINARHDISNHGGPLWVARELNSTFGMDTRIVGRTELPSGGHSGASSPELLWKAITRRCGPDAPRLKGIVQVGLIHPSVQALLEVADEGDGVPSLTGFGANTVGGVAGLRARRLRDLGAEAGVAFVQAMESVCPGDPAAAFAQLLKRRSFQSWLPEHVRKALSPTALRDQALKLPFVSGLVDVFHKLEGFRARRQHLALFAPFFPYNVTMSLFGVTRWQVLMARLHAAEHGAERPVPPAVASFRVKGQGDGRREGGAQGGA